MLTSIIPRKRDMPLSSNDNFTCGKRRRVNEEADSAAPQENARVVKSCDEQPCLDPYGPESPDAFLRKVVKYQSGIEIIDEKSRCSSISPEFFETISEEEMASYTTVVASAVRGNKVEELKKLQEDGLSLNCCNRFGESLLHVACRRGFVDMAKMILDQPGISVRISDDCGRTPLHDLCWNPSPQLEICKLLLEREPSLFFLRDKRNFTPFDYARQEHWPIWKKFVLENKQAFQTLEEETYDFMRIPL